MMVVTHIPLLLHKLAILYTYEMLGVADIYKMSRTQI